MSFVMPGQKIEASALAVIAEVPWWAACRAERHVGLSEGGMTMRSLLMTMPSLLYRCFRNWWYSLIGGGSWCLNSGSPSSMAERRRTMFSSDDVAPVPSQRCV